MTIEELLAKCELVRASEKKLSECRPFSCFLGHSDNLITLSQALAYIREVTTPFILRAGRPRQGQCKPSAEPSSLGLCRGAACPRPSGQYTAFLAFTQEKSACFLSPSDDCGEDGDRHEETSIFLLTVLIQFKDNKKESLSDTDDESRPVATADAPHGWQRC